ncbi:hypothetical protein ACS0TY_017335 [Phlomoides rotata]
MASSSFDRNKSVQVAEVAEEAERYDDMAEAMKNVAKTVGELTAHERTLLSGGCGKAITRRRDSWGILSKLEQKEESKGNEVNVGLIKEYKRKVETEITDICTDMLSIIDEHLIPSASTPNSTVYYYTMRGDYYRYLAEIKTGDDRKETADNALLAYETAMGSAEVHLRRADPTRLGLDLNLAVFYHVILGSTERACHIADQVFDEAIPDLSSLSEKEYKESSKWINLLKENITKWNNERTAEDFTGL